MALGSHPSAPLGSADYHALAEFRYQLRRFLAFSEQQASSHGLTPQQHQAMLAICAAPGGLASIGFLAERLLLKSHSVTGLVQRLESAGMVSRIPSAQDRRQSLLQLSDAGQACLEALSDVHREELRRLRPVLGALLAQWGPADTD